MIATLAICAGVVVLPGLAALFLVRRFGWLPGLAILLGLAVWCAVTLGQARNPGNVAIAPEIFGGQTIGHSQRLGLREAAFALFVLGPSLLWTAVATLIGRASHRRTLRQDVPS